MVHHARGVVPISFADVSGSAIALISALPFVAAAPDLLVLLDGTVTTDSVIVGAWETDLFFACFPSPWVSIPKSIVALRFVLPLSCRLYYFLLAFGALEYWFSDRRLLPFRFSASLREGSVFCLFSEPLSIDRSNRQSLCVTHPARIRRYLLARPFKKLCTCANRI